MIKGYPENSKERGAGDLPWCEQGTGQREGGRGGGGGDGGRGQETVLGSGVVHPLPVVKSQGPII